MFNRRVLSFAVSIIAAVALLLAYVPGPQSTSKPEFMEILGDLQRQTDVEFVVFITPERLPNALALRREYAQELMPGVGITTHVILITQGLLDSEPPNMVAVTLGHEIGHLVTIFAEDEGDLTADRFYFDRFHAAPHDQYTYTEAAADIIGMKLARQAGYNYTDYPQRFQRVYRFINPPYISLTMARENIVRNYIDATTNILYRTFWR